MNIEIHIDPDCTEPKLVIHTDRMTDELRSLVQRLSAPDAVTVRTDRGVELLPPETILRVYSEGQKVYVQSDRGVFPVKARLYEMESRLAGQGFVRISGSELVNIRMITGMDFSLTGTIRVSLQGGVTTYVSRRHVAAIKKLFDV